MALVHGDLRTARTLAEDFARTHPRDAHAFLLLGHVLIAAGEKPRGLAAYREALRMDLALGADPELLANLRASFLDAEDEAFKLAEEIGYPATPGLADLKSTTPDARLRRRADEVLSRILLKQRQQGAPR
jgi:hypothetical protein